jgi:hypothetical protein
MLQSKIIQVLCKLYPEFIPHSDEKLLSDQIDKVFKKALNDSKKRYYLIKEFSLEGVLEISKGWFPKLSITNIISYVSLGDALIWEEVSSSNLINDESIASQASFISYHMKKLVMVCNLKELISRSSRVFEMVMPGPDNIPSAKEMEFLSMFEIVSLEILSAHWMNMDLVWAFINGRKDKFNDIISFVVQFVNPAILVSDEKGRKLIDMTFKRENFSS